MQFVLRFNKEGGKNRQNVYAKCLQHIALTGMIENIVFKRKVA